MKKATPAADPDAYVAGLDGWQLERVKFLRKAVRGATPSLEETIKWGHLVYLSNGPVLFIRAENERILFGFWRGQQLTSNDSRLKPGGKYEMATLEMRQEAKIAVSTVRRMVKEAVALNARFGNPQLAATKQSPAKPKAAQKPTKKTAKRTSKTGHSTKSK